MNGIDPDTSYPPDPEDIDLDTDGSGSYPKESTGWEDAVYLEEEDKS